MDHTHSHAYEEDWDELEVLLSSIVGVYASPPENAVTGSFTKGAILGNGDVGVAVGGDYNTVSFYIGKNDFWTDDAPLNTDEHRFRGVRPITLGGIDIRIGRVGMAPYRMEQDILNAEVRATLSVDKSAVYLRSWTSATENLLVTDIRSEGEESLPVTIETWAPTQDAYPVKRWDVLPENNGDYATQAGAEGDVIWSARETHRGPDVRWVARAAVATRLSGAPRLSRAQYATDGAHRSCAIFTLGPGQRVRILSAIHGGKGVSDATFAAIPFVWHYEYTQDIGFLRDKAYPLMRELADFWEDYLQKDEGERYVVYAASYEGYQDINPAQDLGFIRLLFSKLIAFSRLLRVDEDRHERWQDILDHISDPPTTTYEGTTVYNHAEVDEFLVAFTTDNLEWIFPGECLSLGSDPAALQIAQDTIRLGDAWKQGNNVPKIFPQAMRVGYPVEETIREFKSLLKSNFRDNLTLYETGGGIETRRGHRNDQYDAVTEQRGFPSAVSGMVSP